MSHPDRRRFDFWVPASNGRLQDPARRCIGGIRHADCVPTLRRYESGDETSWTRCRTLAFLKTAYFDDVLQAKPTYDGTTLEFVAFDDEDFAGLIDVAFDESTATIATVAVHPDHQRGGLATALLEEVVEHLPATVASVDAWTRDDAAANAWYQSRGFVESYRYLHVYANELEIERAGFTTRDGLTAVAGFFHADIKAEAALRDLFGRVHVCRQYVLHRYTPSGRATPQWSEVSHKPGSVPSSHHTIAFMLETGLQPSYVERGDPTGPALVLLPGPTDSWISYEKVLESLPSSIPAIAVSRRVHGDSDKPQSGYRVEDFAADVPPLLEALRIDGAVLAPGTRAHVWPSGE